MDRIPPSARLEAQITELLSQGQAYDGERLAELGRLGARLVLQRAVEDEVTAFLGRARYERTGEATGSRNGTRPKPAQTAEGELTIDMPQVRGTAEGFISRVFPDSRTVIRTRPLEALIIGGYVRGLSDRDIESLMQEAGLGEVSKSTASRICRELRARYKAFCARSLADVELLALFLDAIYLPTRPSGEKEGVLVAWGYTTQGKRELVAVRLGQRERHEDWLDLGRDLTRRGLRAPWLVVSDGAPGLIKAIEELWPEADRQRCTVHRLRNILAKLPKRHDLHEWIKGAYWAALDEATDPQEAEQRLRDLVGDMERVSHCLAEDLPALLERSLEEVRRRTKVIGRFPGETSCLRLTWAVLDIFITAARGLGLSDLEYRQVAQFEYRSRRFLSLWGFPLCISAKPNARFG